jgi:hypothetical protein
MLHATGADPRIGLKLHATFVAAGLGEPAMRLEAIIGGGETCADYLRRGVADLIGSVADDIVRLGIASAAEVGIDTLGDRLVEEALANGSVIVGRSEMGAWARV